VFFLNRSVKIIAIAILVLCCFCAVALADGDIVAVDAGLQTTDKDALADKLKDIFTGIGWFIGIVAVGALILCGFRLTMAKNEQKREEIKDHIKWVLAAVVLVALAMMIVGYVVSLVGGTS
jgi:peptidoglycan biosynthesis protein MviN/MurJ (putative lipid II flippase)